MESPEVAVSAFCKKTALKTYAELTGKQWFWSLFLKTFQGFSETGVCFPVNLVKFLRTPILENICELLLFRIKYYAPSNNTAEPSLNIAKQQEKETQFVSESFKSKLTFHYLIIFTFAYI